MNLRVQILDDYSALFYYINVFFFLKLSFCRMFLNQALPQVLVVHVEVLPFIRAQLRPLNSQATFKL